MKKRLAILIIPNNQSGFTLVELIIVLALIGTISTIVLSMFFTGISSFHIADDQVESYSSARAAFLYLEKQIKTSQEIYHLDVDGEVTIFVQDLESPDEFYNYYTLNLINNILYRNKVEIEKNSLTFEKKSTYPFISNIKEFNLYYDDTEKLFILNIVSEIDGEKRLQLNSHIRVGVNITN